QCTASAIARHALPPRRSSDLKRAIEDHFDYPFELLERLKEAGKLEQREELIRIANLANFTYLRQKGHLGNATPILNAAPIIGEEDRKSTRLNSSHVKTSYAVF